MKKAIIATIGNYKSYREANVFFGGRALGRDKYHPRLMAKYLGADLIIYRLDNEITKNSIENLGLEDYEVITFKEEGAFEFLLDSFYKKVKEYDEIYFDFTHSMRNLSFIFLLAALTFGVNLRTKNINFIYGVFDDKGEETNIVSMNEYRNKFREIFELTNTIRDLDFNHLARTIIEKHQKKEFDESYESMNATLSVLINLNLGNVNDDFLLYFKNWIEKEDEGYLDFLLRENLRRFYDLINEESIYLRQYNLGLETFKRGNLQLGIQLLREAYISKLLEENGKSKKEVYNFEERKNAEEILQANGRKGRKEHDWLFSVRNALAHPLTTDASYTYLSEKEVNLFSRVEKKEKTSPFKFNPKSWKSFESSVKKLFEGKIKVKSNLVK